MLPPAPEIATTRTVRSRSQCISEGHRPPALAGIRQGATHCTKIVDRARNYNNQTDPNLLRRLSALAIECSARRAPFETLLSRPRYAFLPSCW